VPAPAGELSPTRSRYVCFARTHAIVRTAAARRSGSGQESRDSECREGSVSREASAGLLSAPAIGSERHGFRRDPSVRYLPHPGGGECTPVMMFQYSTFFDAKPRLTNVTTLVSSNVIMWLPFGL
jgi:hypothetical protein